MGVALQRLHGVAVPTAERADAQPDGEPVDVHAAVQLWPGRPGPCRVGKARLRHDWVGLWMGACRLVVRPYCYYPVFSWLVALDGPAAGSGPLWYLGVVQALGHWDGGDGLPG